MQLTVHPDTSWGWKSELFVLLCATVSFWGLTVQYNISLFIYLFLNNVQKIAW